MATTKILTDLDLSQNELQQAALENLASDPSTGVEGQMYFNTTTHKVRVYSNGAWMDCAAQYALPAADTTTRGGVKVGSHLNSTDTDVLNVDEASASQKGVVELATNAETLTGTDTERAITPAGLHSTVGVAGGIAGLDSNGLVPSGQLPSYVDDVVEGYLSSDHWYTDAAHTTLSPSDQQDGKIYVELSTNLSYRWSGSTYVEISPSIALGETSSTAYRGDRGKTAYDHATDANRVTTAVTSGLYKIGVTSEGHVASVAAATSSDIPGMSTAESNITALQTTTAQHTNQITDLQNDDVLHDPRYNWRTPSKDEWDYLLNTRSASTLYDDYTQTDVANARYTKAQVNGINGLIIIPDTFSYPANLDLGGLSHFQNINTANTPFTRNTCNLTNWVLLENTGCIFLPAAGTRSAASFTAGRAYYHSSSIKNENQKYYLFFRDNNLNATDEHYLYMGHSVRCISNNSVGAFSVSATTKCDFARGNLQYHCKQNKWRFARNQYDIIGADNANIAQNYDGWIDLFGYGTSGWKSQAVCYQPWNTSMTNSAYRPDGTGAADLTGNYALADWGVFASHGYASYDLSLHHSVLAANATSVAFGASPEYQILPMTSDLTVKITAVGNSEKNYVLIYPTDGTFHEVTVQLDSGLSGYTLIGELKSMPTGEYAPFSGTPNITVNNAKALELAVVRSGSYIVISWSLVGYKS